MAYTHTDANVLSRTLSNGFEVPSLQDISEEVQSALQTYNTKDTATKVVIMFRSVGNTPVLSQNMFQVTASNQFETVIRFLRRKLGWSPRDPLHTYINSAFAPAPDDVVANLYKLFSTGSHLIVNYSTTAAWG